MASYTDVMLRVGGSHEVAQSRPKLEPRVSHYYGAARAPYRRGRRTQRFVTGTAFDEIR